MTKSELKTLLGNDTEMAFTGMCHDCGAETTIIAGINDEGIYAQGGAVYKVSEVIKNDGIFIKCQECFDKDKVLRNWRDTEVFSRVVGYLRPIQNWNKGKIEEFRERKVFNLNKAVKEA
jgi:hypothetical protein